MKQNIKNLALWVFAIIGMINTILFFVNQYNSSKEAKEYAQNCEKVKVGMSVEEAKKIMGDYDYYEKTTRSEIWPEDLRLESPRKFYLNYPASSTPHRIYFDPNTMIVTKVFCGE